MCVNALPLSHTHTQMCLILLHSGSRSENIISERGGCVFARLGVMTVCTFPVTSTTVQDSTCRRIPPYLLCAAVGLHCVRVRAMCVISGCVSYDLSPLNEELSAGVGVSVSGGQ